MAILPLLHRVQEIESRLVMIEQSLRQLKENPNLKALKLLQQELDQTIRKAETELAQLRSKQSRSDLELQSCQERLQLEEGKLYSGSIVQPRELEQVQQKVVEYQSLRSRLEEEILELMEKDETQSAGLAELLKRQKGTANELVKLERELKQQASEVIFEQEQLALELEDLLPQIPADWLEKYRRIAGSHRGVGIARLRQNSCGACHVSLSESKLQQVKRGEDKLNFCENCGRILYYS